ncbi:DUF2332 domain-containing protein [Pseudooceanicola marinus]|uniref:DUF2332 domain-containing protein n=1 Tax=Pseudooceanicola marinus TaxID=396013 RepID=UPI001CD80991|nr:DUF2332 family protein [Pseudooceanicola marinus]MCA1335524.1 DUF2332 family protein [Pseudooceanicola marinus]
MTGAAPAPWQAHFLHQAEACEGLGSDFTAGLLRLLSQRMRGGAVARRVAHWAPDRLGPDAVALRLAGGLHALVLMGRDRALAAVYPPYRVADEALWEALAPALMTHEAHLLHWLDSAPQTNEIRRAAGLILGAQVLAARFPGLPLKLSELGASAGLNLAFDRYALQVGGQSWGARDPVLTLSPDWEGALPPEGRFQVADARGVDLNPLDPGKPEDVLRLRSYLWPDQPGRRALLDAALAVAAPRVDRGDAAAWLAERLAPPAEGRLHLVYHTIAWQYFPEVTKAACLAALEAAGARATEAAPLARLSFEADGNRPGALLRLTTWPDGTVQVLGRMDFHGRWLHAA